MNSAAHGEPISAVEITNISPHGIWLLLGDEELLMDSERDKMTRTAHKKIFVANVDKIDDAQYDHMMQVLQCVEDKNDERAVEAIAEILPTYHPAKNRPGNKPEQAAG